MEALPNISHILSDEWEEFWQETDQKVLEDFHFLDKDKQVSLSENFLRS